MIAALDVHYDNQALTANAAAVVFSHWAAGSAHKDYSVACRNIQPYQPGQFYKRELPCLLAVLGAIEEPLEAIIIDGYVRLGDEPGLGFHLWEALRQTTPIVGVAKTRFRSVDAEEVTRGNGRNPLYITAIGVDVRGASENVRAMAGPHRFPTMLRRVDQLARKPPKEAPV